MSNITLRQDLGNTEPRSANVIVKNSGLSNIELDNNFNNINNTVENNSGNIEILFNTVSTVYDQANNALLAANNSALAVIAYDQANSATTIAQSAYDQANTATNNAGNAFNQANTALSTAQYAYNNSNTKFSSSGGSISGNVQIDGTLTVSGNVVTVSANNLSIQDNMIYLNEGTSGNSNPDLGFAGAYRDPEYHHAGFFRDASDGIWKVFDNYKPEPDASVWIDTSNNTFRIANFQANSVFFGKITTSSTELVANLNSNFVGGLDVSYTISAFNQANNALITAQSAYGQANTATTNAGNAFNQANTANINAADASFLTSGTVQTARLGSGTANASTYLAGDNSWKPIGLTNIPNSSLANSSVTINGTAISLGSSGTVTAAAGTLTGTTLNSTVVTSSLTSVGTVTSGTWSGSFGAVSGANLTTLNASNLSSGTVATARLGSGTASSTTYLRGDSTWQTVSGFSTTDDTITDATYYPVIATTAGGSTAKTSSTKLYFNPSTGTLSSTKFNSLSDLKFKENVKSIESALQIVNEINPVEFTWKDNGNVSYGFIAQELEEILPAVVTTEEHKSVDYNSIIAVLTKSIQELSEELQKLKEYIQLEK